LYNTVTDAISEAGADKVTQIQYNVTSADDSASLKNAIERGATTLIAGVIASSTENVIIDSDLTIPSNVRFIILGGSALTVAEGAKLRTTTLTLNSGSTLNVLGKIRGQASVSTGATVTPASAISRKSSVSNGCYTAYFDGAKATSLTVTDNGENVSNTTITVDMNQQPTYQLGAVAEPVDDASQIFTWKSSATSIATVDAEGLVKFLKPGTVTITATATDGSKKTAKVTFSVYYKDKAKSFTAKLADTSDKYHGSIKTGLQLGDTVSMSVFGTDKTTAMPVEDFTYTSSNTAIATVDESGVITAVKAGTATITAKLTGDPLNRKITVTVKVIPVQIATVTLVPVEENNAFRNNEELGYALYVDKIAKGEPAQNFQIKAIAKDGAGEPIDVTKGKFTWTSSVGSIASVKENADGTATITVKANVNGAVVITATAKDLTKSQGTMSVNVMDYTPRLEASSLTIDTQKVGTASLALVESYENEIKSVALKTYSSSSKSYVDDDRFEVAYADSTLTVTANSLVSNQTIKGHLIVETAKGDYTLTLNLVVKNSTPGVTVKQSGKFNLFYLDSSLNMTVTVAGVATENITDITFGDNSALTGEYDKDNGVFTVMYKDDFTGTPNGKGNLYITVDGYAHPIKKAITVSTVNTKPSLKLTSASGTINTLLGESSVLTGVYNNTAKADLDLSNAVINTTSTTATVNKTEDNRIQISSEKACKVAISVKDSNWLSAITLNYTLSVNTKKPTVKLAKSTLTLNSLYGKVSATTDLTLSQANLSASNLKDTVLTAAKATSETAKLDVQLFNGQITASIIDTTIKNGSYAFYFIPEYVNGDTTTTLAKVTVTVKVINTAPTGKLSKTSVSLNNKFSSLGTEFTVIPTDKDVTVTNVNIVSTAKANTAAYNNAQKINFNYEDGVVKVKLDESNVPATGSYSFKVTATVQNQFGIATMKALNLAVRVVNTVPKVKLSASTLSLNRITNLAGVESASLTVSSATSG
jgi:uncharacterized protein YjdB